MRPFGWGSVARLGVAQACLGAIVVLTTSTLNRVMVVELALPALLPGLLVALHYAVQIARPRMGHGSDVGGRRTPWIIGGMAVLALGGVLSALATVWMASQPGAGLALAVLGFSLVGLGVSASGTSLLVLLAKRVPEGRRGGAATMVWMMMIAGFALTAGLAGHFLDPYSPQRLLLVTATVSVAAWIISVLAVRGLEGHETTDPAALVSSAAPKPRFREALAQVWAEPVARRFTIFVFVSMLAYSAQDLILEPFAGAVHGYTPGASTQLAGVQHGGVLAGMLLVALAGAIAARWSAHPVLRHIGSLRAWTVGGCIASALALLGLMLAGLQGAGWPLKLNVFALGVANGAFSIGAIGSMMRLAHQGGPARAGIRMGLWGAAQAMAFGIGGLIGTGASDLAHHLLALPGSAYASVFALEGAVFLLSAVLAWRISTTTSPHATRTRLHFPTPASP
ncbi:BCD family MFS transporter [Hydrogenophaga sp.]|uniref:BCD family MFS transporter n=1 Tax=Hydrogenophaga sp. TaxID=1904254 RepID=UPI0025B96095|nr:BCD family MFS transporter [Hydrogenophaga sp.]